MEERLYATQMEAARKGIVTKELEIVAKKEKMEVKELLPLVASGKVVIPANKNHKCLDPEGIGSMLKTKINVNLGISKDCKDYDVEMEKVMSAVKMGGEAIMDLSSHGNTQPFRKKLTSECPAMIGTVPVYDSVIHYQRDLDTLTAKDFIDVVRLHAQDGVDFVTLHCGITRKTIEQIRKHKRKMNIVSRGGSLVFAWMCMTGEENPFYEYYDEILDICREYDVTVSLGDACRPGCLADATDVCQIEELVRLGELTKRAWEKDVQVMVEGPGHVPMDQIAANMKVQQTICMGAPFYVLGPLVTDIAPGYDHITAAIGGAIAAMSGAAFLCYVTPAEHLALPNLDDVKQGDSVTNKAGVSVSIYQLASISHDEVNISFDIVSSLESTGVDVNDITTSDKNLNAAKKLTTVIDNSGISSQRKQIVTVKLVLRIWRRECILSKKKTALLMGCFLHF